MCNATAKAEELLQGFDSNLTRVQNLLNCASQGGRVLHIMLRGKWLTLWEVHEAIKTDLGCMDSEAAISARLRDLRNQFGITIISRPRKPSSAHEYALLGGEVGV